MPKKKRGRERTRKTDRESTETKIFLVVAVTAVLAIVVVSALSHSLRRLLISMLDLCSID